MTARVPMRVIEAKRTDFKHEGECWLVYSRPKFDMEKGEYGPEDGPLVVSLFGPGCEISVEALTHGEGMVILADVMKSLGKKLATEALEKEGAFKNPCIEVTDEPVQVHGVGLVRAGLGPALRRSSAPLVGERGPGRAQLHHLHGDAAGEQAMSKASLMSDMDEFTLSALRAEVVERERRKAARVCTHCARDYWTVACKFPRRHNGTEF